MPDSKILIEMLGYTASILVLVSLIMSSTKKLRWINLFGSGTFFIYALIIKSYPVAILNVFTIMANVYYLNKIYNSKSYFNILKIQKNNEYFEYFVEHNKQDMKKIYKDTDIDYKDAEYSFYILRDIMPVGVFIANKYDNKTLKVELDYVIPSYRDFKAGKYIYGKNKDIFLSKGYTKLITFADNQKHEKYLKKMGFEKVNDSKKSNTYLLQLND
ncbi:MAG: GNAT family N-acetyltransferase [Candidatus Izimaplasma sp.]|nr:GNAT family N-acetyltransferase [Candidatus Izimaplasma bacterium]